MSANELTVWKILPLVDCSINPTLAFEYITPSVPQPHRKSALHCGSLIAPHIGWKDIWSKTHWFHFDVLYAEKDGKTALPHCILHPVDDEVDKGSPILILIGWTPWITMSYQAPEYIKWAWMSSSESVYFWAENYKVVVVLLTLASSKEDPNQCSVGILWKSDSEQEPDAEVCPFSGRDCTSN